MPTVLVIDDDSGTRLLLEKLLLRKGYAVIVSADGATGLDLFRRLSPDAIVLDLNMPGFDGMTVLQQVRALNERIPVII